MRNKVLVGIIFVFCLAIVFYPFLLQKMADFLIVQNDLEKADVILVLAGDTNGERVAQAVKLYKTGWAPKVLMSGGTAIWNVTYAQNMKDQARYLRVPAKDILLQDRSESTYEDLKYSLEILKRIGAKKVIIVSSPYHMRRLSLAARKMYGKEDIKIIVFPAQKTKWNKKRWWLRHEDTQPVAWEYMALLQYLLKGWLI